MKRSLGTRASRKIASAADVTGSEYIGIPDQTGPIANASPAGTAANPRDIAPDRRSMEHSACIRPAPTRARRPMRHISETCMSSRRLRYRPYLLRCWKGQVSARRWPGGGRRYAKDPAGGSGLSFSLDRPRGISGEGRRSFGPIHDGVIVNGEIRALPSKLSSSIAERPFEASGRNGSPDGIRH